MQFNTNSFVKKLGLKFLTKPRFQARSKSKTRRGSLAAEGVTNNPYILSGPGSRATRSMDILRKPQPFGSMLAVNTAAYLDVDGEADAVRHSMDESGRSSSSREWKASLSNDVNSKGSVAQGLAVAALVAGAEVGVQAAPVRCAPLPIGCSPHSGSGTLLERPGAARASSDHTNKHSLMSGSRTSTSGVDNPRRPSTSTSINTIKVGTQSMLEQSAGHQVHASEVRQCHSTFVLFIFSNQNDLQSLIYAKHAFARTRCYRPTHRKQTP